MVFKNLWFLTARYFYTFLTLFDPIEDFTKENKNTYFWGQKMSSKNELNQHLFLGPAISIFLLELVGVAGLHFDSTRTLANWSAMFTSSPYIFIHQAMPVEVWPQMRSFFSVSIQGGILSALVLATESATPLLDETYRLVAESVGQRLRERSSIRRNDNFKIKNGSGCILISKRRVPVHRCWEIEESGTATILTYRANVRKYFYIAHVCLGLEMSTQYAMVYINSAFQWSVISVIFWVLIFPLSIFHAIFGMFYFFKQKLIKNVLQYSLEFLLS